MTDSMQASVARMVAKLVSKRATRLEEIPGLFSSVYAALAELDIPSAPKQEQEQEHEKPEAAPSVPALRVVRRRRAPVPVVTPVAEAPVVPAQPRLLRRAEIASDHPPELQMASVLRPATVRGVVKWFDPRTRRGALRLPGCGDEIVVEPALLDEMSIQRLYKGQEIEATLSGNESAPRVVRLTLPGGAWQVAASGGVVHNRHARPVLVELKREALTRAAARAEAELVLGRRSGR